MTPLWLRFRWAAVTLVGCAYCFAAPFWIRKRFR